MNDQRKIKILSILMILLFSTPAYAVPVLDGVMRDDWGTHFTNGEETFGTSTSATYVGPGWGGQAFDIEKIGLQFDSGNVYFGLQTGFNFLEGVISNGVTYTAGDLFIDFGSDHTWDLAIGLKSFNVSTVGTYNDPTIRNSTPFDLATGKNVGSATGVYGGGTNTFDEDFYSLEGVLDLKAMDLEEFYGQSAIIHWTMSCGNDVLEHSESAPVPEPATLLLLGSGLMGVAGIRRKIKK